MERDKYRVITYDTGKIEYYCDGKLHREDADLNRGRGSVFSNHQVSFFDENGEKVMEYQETKGELYVARDFISPLKVFSFDEEEINRLIKWWFTNRVRIEPEDVYLFRDLRD